MIHTFADCVLGSVLSVIDVVNGIPGSFHLFKIISIKKDPEYLGDYAKIHFVCRRLDENGNEVGLINNFWVHANNSIEPGSAIKAAYDESRRYTIYIDKI